MMKKIKVWKNFYSFVTFFLLFEWFNFCSGDIFSNKVAIDYWLWDANQLPGYEINVAENS